MLNIQTISWRYWRSQDDVVHIVQKPDHIASEGFFNLYCEQLPLSLDTRFRRVVFVKKYLHAVSKNLTLLATGLLVTIVTEVFHKSPE